MSVELQVYCYAYCMRACVCQDGGRQLFQRTGPVGGPPGVLGSSQRAGPCLRSDSGLDGCSLLPPAAGHQHHEVHHPLLLQEGEDNV